MSGLRCACTWLVRISCLLLPTLLLEHHCVDLMVLYVSKGTAPPILHPGSRATSQLVVLESRRSDMKAALCGRTGTGWRFEQGSE